MQHMKENILHWQNSIKIKKAAEIIKNGGLVSFPTETVYGLGANGLDIESFNKIYQAKQRPSDNPLIFHISDKKQLANLINNTNEKAEKLMEKFWPGPLTIVFQKNKKISKQLTSGLDTIAIRMPSNKIALELIKQSNLPIVAPSANLSGKPSPTKAEHVFEDLNGKIDMILDGGEVNIGLESTVVDLSKESEAYILRPGKISKKEIEEVIGKISSNKSDNTKKKEQPKAPGMKYKHYSPTAKVLIYNSQEQYDKLIEENKKKKIITLKYSSLKDMGKYLFRDFRKADNDGFEIILVKSVENEDFGEAIMNRLLKAASN